MQDQAKVSYQDLVAKARERKVFKIPEIVVQAYRNRQVNLRWDLHREEAQALAAVLMRDMPEGEARECFAATLQIMDIIQEKVRLAVFAYGFEEIYEVAVSEVKFPPLPSSLKAAVSEGSYEFVTRETVREMQERSGVAVSLGQAGTIFSISAQVEWAYEEFHEVQDKLKGLVANKDRLDTWGDELYCLLLETFLKHEAPVFYNEGRRAALAHVMGAVFKCSI